ncbi:MAG: NAD-dependent epimerase/dehydratase family protein [bacterium]|nr:NAD-dependent epimerase/dehydratase family protein [bacterium]
MKGKKVVVTGGCGFIGSHLVNRLIEDGYKVLVIDKKKPKLRIKHAEARYKKMVVESIEAADAIKKFAPSILFHLAAHIDDREAAHRPVMNAENNIIGTVNLLEACRSLTKKPRFIFASTGEFIYGNADQLPTPETANVNPLTPYAISKLAAEQYLHFYKNVYGISTVALRFSNVFGPGQDEKATYGAIGIFTGRLLRGESVYLNNDGTTTRDYLYIDDAVDALVKAAVSDEAGVFNIGTGIARSTQDVLDAIREITHVRAKAEMREEMEDLVKHSSLLSHRAEQIFGWHPQISFENGLQKTAEWYSENL